MKLLMAILFGFTLLTSSVQAAIVYPHIDYQPPTYDVGHPELITESNVLLSPQELKKRSARKRKLATLSISQEAVDSVLKQAELLVPKKPIYVTGDGQTYGTPEAERDIIWWRSTFKQNAPELNLQISIPDLERRFDNLKIVEVIKQIKRFEEDKRPMFFIYLRGNSLKGIIEIKGNSLEQISLANGSIRWLISRSSDSLHTQYELYRSTYILGGNDTLTPDPETVRKHLEKYNKHHVSHTKPQTIGQNPHRIDVYFIYEPGFNTSKIQTQITRGIDKFNQLLINASGPSSFYIHSLGFGPAPPLACKPHAEPCNNLHKFDVVLEAMSESTAITQLRREPYKQADLIIMLRTNSEYGVIGDHSEWTIVGKSYNPQQPINATNFKWSVGAVTGNAGDFTTEAIAHEIGHLMNAHHSTTHPDYEERDHANPNNALLNHYFTASPTCPIYHAYGYRTFMAYEAVCNHKYRDSRPISCPPINCHTVDRFSENGETANVKEYGAARVIIGTPEHSNFTVMNTYAHTIVNYSVEAQKMLPPVARISQIQGNKRRWEKQCWNAKNSQMNSGIFHNAKWWVLVDGAIQVSETVYRKDQSFCYRPLSNKQHTVKLRITRQDSLSHTTELSFTSDLPIIDNLNLYSDLSYVNLSYGFTEDIQPPTFVYYHIYEKNHSQTKPAFRHIETTNATSASFLRISSLGERLDYKVKVCADVGDCSGDSDVKTIIVDLWSALISDPKINTPTVISPLVH